MKPDQSVPTANEQRDHREEHIDEAMYLLQANIDDSSPEWLGHTMEKLFQAGANDVIVFPVTMKKGRPGHMVQVMCYQSQLEIMKEILFRETTTFGIRYFPVSCHRLGRRFVNVKTKWGDVNVKIGYFHKERVQVSPEYADCVRVAGKSGVSLREVYLEAQQLARQVAPERLPD